MTIARIVAAGKGTAGKWKVKEEDGYCQLYHYSTLMLEWEKGTTIIVKANYGHGSKSDQDGMNKAFRVLNSTWYYSRKGGAHIEL